jgi:hypothetical protein
MKNFCTVRLSYALTWLGHPITIPSDYKDKDGNKYIIKCSTMKKYLYDKYGKGTKIYSLIVYKKDPKIIIRKSSIKYIQASFSSKIADSRMLLAISILLSMVK